MSGKRYTEEFKIAAVKQVAERGHPTSEAVARLGVRIHSLYTWTKRYGVPEEERKDIYCSCGEISVRAFPLAGVRPWLVYGWRCSNHKKRAGTVNFRARKFERVPPCREACTPAPSDRYKLIVLKNSGLAPTGNERSVTRLSRTSTKA